MIMPFTHILQTIELVRNSFNGSEIVYTNGSCIKFAMILKHLYPEGKILYDLNHAIFEYDEKYFDINGFANYTKNHIPIEEYGILKMYNSMNLKYEKSSDYPKVITRLITTITKYWQKKDKEKLLFYTNRLKNVLESVT